MQITLNQSELDEAIEDYVRSQININDDQSITIDLKATRGAEGNTATIDIRKAGAKPAKTTKPAYRGNKPGPKPKAAKPEPEDEPETKPETTVEDEAPEQETTSPEPDVTPDEAIEDVAEGEAEVDPHAAEMASYKADADARRHQALKEEKAKREAAEEKPARTPGSIFSRAG